MLLTILQGTGLPHHRVICPQMSTVTKLKNYFLGFLLSSRDLPSHQYHTALFSVALEFYLKSAMGNPSALKKITSRLF